MMEVKLNWIRKPCLYPKMATKLGDELATEFVTRSATLGILPQTCKQHCRLPILEIQITVRRASLSTDLRHLWCLYPRMGIRCNWSPLLLLLLILVGPPPASTESTPIFCTVGFLFKFFQPICWTICMLFDFEGTNKTFQLVILVRPASTESTPKAKGWVDEWIK